MTSCYAIVALRRHGKGGSIYSSLVTIVYDRANALRIAADVKMALDIQTFVCDLMKPRPVLGRE